MGKPLPTTSILDAMIKLVKAWIAVKEKTIVNCFRKAGINPEAQSSAVNDDHDPFKDIEVENDTMADLQHHFDAFRQSHPDLVLVDANAEELMSVDPEVETSGPVLLKLKLWRKFWAKEKNRMAVMKMKVIEVDDDPLLPPSTYSVENAIETLSKFSLFYEDDKLRRGILDF